jgi:hypothetical protein
MACGATPPELDRTLTVEPTKLKLLVTCARCRFVFCNPARTGRALADVGAAGPSGQRLRPSREITLDLADWSRSTVSSRLPMSPMLASAPCATGVALITAMIIAALAMILAADVVRRSYLDQRARPVLALDQGTRQLAPRPGPPTIWRATSEGKTDHFRRGVGETPPLPLDNGTIGAGSKTCRVVTTSTT